MRTLKMTDVIRLSLSRTADILFKPFNMKKWLILIFIAIFAGSITSYNSNSGSSGSKRPAKQQAAKSASQVSATQSAATGSGTGTAPAQSQGTARQAGAEAFRKAIVPLIAAIALFLIIFFLLAMWLGSRFKFIWFNAIAANDASVIEPFHRHRLQGNSLFGASVVLMLIFIAALAAIIGWGAFNASRAGVFASGFVWSFKAALPMLAGPVVLFILFIIAATILGVAIENFVIMIMALDKIAFMPALRKTMRIYRENLRDIVLFHLVLLGLAIVCGILTMVLVITVVILFLLLGLVIFGLGYFIFVATAKLTVAFVLYCIILGVPFLAAAILALLCVQLPLAVFLRSFPIEYLCSLGYGYNHDVLAAYGKEKSVERSKTAVVLPVILLILFFMVFIVGLLAAIAIPNFIKARQTVMQKQQTTQSPGRFSSSYGVQR